MKNHVSSFLFGLGSAFAVAFVFGAFKSRRRHVAGWREPLVDINSATREQLMSLGIVDSFTLERLEESRPYRNKLELVSRMVVTDDVYERIKRDIVVRKAREPIKVAG